MKKLLLLSFISIAFASKLFAQAAPDGGFEYWNTYSWMDPQYFNSSNEQIVRSGGTSFNATRVTPGYHGSYALSLTTTVVSPAYVINANANNGNFKGGIPYTLSKKPTGVRFHYQYAPNTNDTAAVLVIFKKLGSVIDSFLVMVTVPSGGYALQTYAKDTSNFALGLTPDTVIVGAISSLGGISGGSGHPGSVFILDSLALTYNGASAQPSELNGDFENWTSDTINVPLSWYDQSYPGVSRTTDAQTGSYALEVQTTTYLGDPEPGQISTGYQPNNCHNNCHETGGKAFTGQVDTLDFAYKYAPHGTDTANVQLAFIKNGVDTFNTSIFLAGTNSTYKDTIIPFNLPNPYDTVIIGVTSSWHNNFNSNSQYAPYVGSVLKIDNMTFASQKHFLSVNNVTAVTGVKAYPNPTTDVLNLQFTNISGAATISVYDITGRQIKQSNVTINSNVVPVSTTGMSSGIYFYRVTTANGSFENKFIKE
jgi:hypothetical protein